MSDVVLDKCYIFYNTFRYDVASSPQYRQISIRMIEARVYVEKKEIVHATGVAAEFRFVIFRSLENFLFDQHWPCRYDVTIPSGSLSAIISVQLGVGRHDF